ncbi:MAG: SGNH/GDSL hydrolase family protein [Victivallales bacterium]
MGAGRFIFAGLLSGIVFALSATSIRADDAGARPAASFAEFDRKAQAGEALSVVFFGGSLTYGANASDPLKASIRGLMARYLTEKYPKAHFTFNDAAIGGTGSDLGLFRLERDVLSKKPDLVFLDFTVNDGYDQKDVESLINYETLLRRIIEKGIPVEQLYFAFKWQFGKAYDLEKVYRRTDHMRLSAAYRTGQGDLYPLMQETITSGKKPIDVLWPFDGAHPDDAGYEVFFDAVRLGYEAAVKENIVCTVPEKPVFGEMTSIKRICLADSQPPKGWAKAKTFRTSLWFDGLSSRWMGDVAMFDVAKDAGNVEPIKLEFEGTFIGLFGEANQDGLDVEIKVDGKVLPFARQQKDKIEYAPVWPFKMTYGQGNLFIWRKSLTALPPGKHVLEIMPVVPEGVKKGQLRIESVCVATSSK